MTAMQHANCARCGRLTFPDGSGEWKCAACDFRPEPPLFYVSPGWDAFVSDEQPTRVVTITVTSDPPADEPTVVEGK